MFKCLRPDTARDVYTSLLGYTFNHEIQQGANRTEFKYFWGYLFLKETSWKPLCIKCVYFFT